MEQCVCPRCGSTAKLAAKFVIRIGADDGWAVIGGGALVIVAGEILALPLRFSLACGLIALAPWCVRVLSKRGCSRCGREYAV